METSEGSVSTTSEYSHLEYEGSSCPQVLLTSVFENSTDAHLTII